MYFSSLKVHIKNKHPNKFEELFGANTPHYAAKTVKSEQIDDEMDKPIIKLQKCSEFDTPLKHIK